MERIITIDQTRKGDILQVSWVTAVEYKGRPSLPTLKNSKRVTVEYSMESWGGQRPIKNVKLGRSYCDVSVVSKANQIHNFHMMGDTKLLGINFEATEALDVIVGILKLSDISDRAAGIVQSVTESYKI